MTKNKSDFAYLAGLLDSSRGEIKENGTVNIKLFEVALKKWLISKIGGQVSGSDINRVWSPNGDLHTEKVLLAVLPYLIGKREEAIQSLTFIRSKSPTTNTTNSSEEELKIESDLIGDYERAQPVMAAA